MGVISFSREQFDAWVNNKKTGLVYYPGARWCCTWCKTRFVDPLPNLGNPGYHWYTCQPCAVEIFPLDYFASYDDAVIARKKHNDYWEKITGTSEYRLEVNNESNG